jgi:hypothetical protein
MGQRKLCTFQHNYLLMIADHTVSPCAQRPSSRHLERIIWLCCRVTLIGRGPQLRTTTLVLPPRCKIPFSDVLGRLVVKRHEPSHLFYIRHLPFPSPPLNYVNLWYSQAGRGNGVRLQKNCKDSMGNKGEYEVYDTDLLDKATTRRARIRMTTQSFLGRQRFKPKRSYLLLLRVSAAQATSSGLHLASKTSKEVSLVDTLHGRVASMPSQILSAQIVKALNSELQLV